MQDMLKNKMSRCTLREAKIGIYTIIQFKTNTYKLMHDTVRYLVRQYNTRQDNDTTWSTWYTTRSHGIRQDKATMNMHQNYAKRYPHTSYIIVRDPNLDPKQGQQQARNSAFSLPSNNPNCGP